MPGQLKPDAFCPVCGRPICAITRKTTVRWMRTRVELEFHHDISYDIDHFMVGQQEDMDRLMAALEVGNPCPAPSVCIGQATLERLKRDGAVHFEEQGVILVAADDLFEKPPLGAGRKFMGKPT